MTAVNVGERLLVLAEEAAMTAAAVATTVLLLLAVVAAVDVGEQVTTMGSRGVMLFSSLTSRFSVANLVVLLFLDAFVVVAPADGGQVVGTDA